jgi:endonuclease-3
MTRDISDIILAKLQAHYGDQRPDLRFGSLYELAIAVVLSAQTTDIQVNSVTPRLFSRYAGFAELAGAKVKDLETIVKSTGFYRNKSKNIIALSRQVMEQYGGRLPATATPSWPFQALEEKLPM